MHANFPPQIKPMRIYYVNLHTKYIRAANERLESLETYTICARVYVYIFVFKLSRQAFLKISPMRRFRVTNDLERVTKKFF